MWFVITIEQLFWFLLFYSMTQQSILHLVVNWEVFTINICCSFVRFIRGGGWLLAVFRRVFSPLFYENALIDDENALE